MDEERHEEINDQLIPGEDLDIAETMERAVEEEIDEEDVKQLASDGGAFPDENI